MIFLVERDNGHFQTPKMSMFHMVAILRNKQRNTGQEMEEIIHRGGCFYNSSTCMADLEYHMVFPLLIPF